MRGFFQKIRRARVSATIFFAAVCVPAAAFGEISRDANAAEIFEKAGSENFPDEKIFGAKTEFFSIAAQDAETVVAVAEIARELENYFFKARETWGKIELPAGTRIEVEIFREPGIFEFSRDGNGNLTLFASEDFAVENSPFRARERLAEILLTQIFFADEKSPRRVPAWIVSAVAEESRLGGFAGRQIFLRKISAKTEPLAPTELLAAREENFFREQFKINALWFLRAVGAHASQFVAAPADARERLIASAFPQFFRATKTEATAENIAAFWATRFSALRASEPTGIDLPEESAKIFDDALLFLVGENGRETRVLASELIAARLDPAIRALVAERLAALSARFRKANPVWHNAFAEFGVFLEMFGDPDVSDETLFAQWNKTILARSRAAELQREVEAALGAEPQK